MDDYLSNAEKPHIHYCFSGMVVEVLIVIGCNNGRELLQRILRILMEQDGWLLLAREG